MKRKCKLTGNIGKFYLYKILTGMFFSVPVLVLFWQDNGLSLTQVMLLQSIFAVLSVILEIPSGYFADVYGRKKTLLIASIMGLMTMISYSLGSRFIHFLVAEIFFALYVSFSSGTTSAFLFDTLKNLHREDEYPKIWGSALFYGLLALALSNSIGGFIAKIDLRLTLYASVPFFFLVIPLVLTMVEPKRHRLIIHRGYTRELVKILKVSLLENRRLGGIILYSGVIFAFNQSALWLYQPYFKITGLDIAYYGVVFASFQIVAAFSSKYAHKIEGVLGQKYSLAMLTFLVGGSYLLMSHYIFLFSFSFCFLQQFVRGFKSTAVSDYINRLTPSEMRATVLSVESFIGRSLYAAIIPLFGWIADAYTIEQALIVMGFTTLLSGSLLLILLKKGKVL